MQDVLGDADDLQPRRIGVREDDVLTEWVAVREKTRRDGLIDDGEGSARLYIVLAEAATGDDRHAQRFVVAGAHQVGDSERPFAGRRTLAPIDEESGLAPV